jgi:excisionase family DNA binding protein
VSLAAFENCLDKRPVQPAHFPLHDQEAKLALLTVQQAAERLNVRPSTVYALCAGRKLPHARLGVGRGTIRIDEADLEDYLRSATVRPGEQAAPEPAACGEKDAAARP